MQDRQELESTATKGQVVNLAELEVAARIHADKEQVGVGGMEGDEVADVGFETADLFTARIERVNQADLVTRLDARGVARSQRESQCRSHAAFLMRALTICGMVRATSRGTTAMQRA